MYLNTIVSVYIVLIKDICIVEKYKNTEFTQEYNMCCIQANNNLTNRQIHKKDLTDSEIRLSFYIKKQAKISRAVTMSMNTYNPYS